MKTVEEIYSEASVLPPDQKLSLAHRLMAATEPSDAEGLEMAWDREIRDRIQRYDQGLTGARPSNEVFAELDERLKK